MLHFVVQLGLTVLAVLCIGSLPYLFFDMNGLLVVQKMIDSGELLNASYLSFDIELRWSQYFHHILESFTQLFHPTKMTYFDETVKPLFPTFWTRYLYSMKVLVAALFIAFILSVSITTAIMMLPNKIKALIKHLFEIIQSIPDIFYLLLLQILAIYISMQTKITLFDFMEAWEPIYGLPIIILTIVPTIQLIQFLILDFEYELHESYVDFAKAKGLGSFRILVIHVLRNTLIAFLRHTNKIFLFSLSNLIMVEILLYMSGFANFLFEEGPTNPDIIPLGLLMLVIPFFFVFFVAKLLAQKWAYGERSDE